MCWFLLESGTGVPPFRYGECVPIYELNANFPTITPKSNALTFREVPFYYLQINEKTIYLQYESTGSRSDLLAPIQPALLAEYTDFAQQLAQVAGATILPYWRLPIDVESKDDESPVTVADRAAELAMRKMVEERYPKHGIVGEEFGVKNQDAEFVWVFDPIDGTKSFVTGKPLFGTLIALLHKGTPIIGVIDQCVLKERWVGSIGNPTTLNGQIVQTSQKATKLDDSILHCASPDMFTSPHEESIFNRVQTKSKLILYGGDCYGYAIVASGFGADGVIEAGLGLHDYCSLVPILEGAGGIMITDWNGRPLSLQNHRASEGRVIASSNAELHNNLLQEIGQPCLE